MTQKPKSTSAGQHDGKRQTNSASPCQIFRPPTIRIRPEQVLRVHGYRDLPQVRPDIVEAARQLSGIAEGLIDAEIHYLHVPVSKITSKVMSLAGGAQFTSEAFQRHCADCIEIAPFVLTTGDRLDAQVRKHIDEFELIEALFLETSGWLAVEAATRLFARDLRARLAREGKRLGMRMGPGYSYKLGTRTVEWPLEQQRELFGLFGGRPLPVTMLESCAMKPKLSRSGFFSITQSADE